MDGFVVRSIVGSPYARAVMATLHEKAVPFSLVPVVPGMHKRPEHLALHPFGRVPVLEHGAFRLYETQAILRYLDRLLPLPALTPPDLRGAARMDQLLGINDAYVFRFVTATLGFQRVVLPRVMGGVPDEHEIAAAMPMCQIVFDALADLLGSQPFLAGAALTLADLLIAPHLELTHRTPEWQQLTARHPHLAAWLARMLSRASFQATEWDVLEAEVLANGSVQWQGDANGFAAL